MSKYSNSSDYDWKKETRVLTEWVKTGGQRQHRITNLQRKVYSKTKEMKIRGTLGWWRNGYAYLYSQEDMEEIKRGNGFDLHMLYETRTLETIFPLDTKYREIWS